MPVYCIGDIHGCYSAFTRLLDEIAFAPGRDTLYLMGDLVDRGPDSASVLRHCMRWPDAIQPLLGNHDLHLLGVAAGVRPARDNSPLNDVLNAPDAAMMLSWLRSLPLAVHTRIGAEDLLILHAGVLPQWSLEETLRLAAEVQAELRGKTPQAFLGKMYGNQPDHWSSDLEGAERLRVIVNTLTRLRFCTPEGVMDFDSTGPRSEAPPGFLPWFEVPGRRTASVTIAFGHWAALGLPVNYPKLIFTDTGCVWGGHLSAVRLGTTPDERALFQVRNPDAPAGGVPAR